MDTRTGGNPNYVGGFSNPTAEAHNTGAVNAPIQNYPPPGVPQPPYPTQNPAGGAAYPPQGAAYPPQGAYPQQQQVLPSYPGPPMILQPQTNQPYGGPVPPPYSYNDNSNKSSFDVEANNTSDVADVIISMNSKDVRLAFTRKVFAILSVRSKCDLKI